MISKDKEKIIEIIKASVETSRPVYPSPAVLTRQLNEKGYEVVKMEIYRLYDEIGIYSLNGLWVMDL